MFPVQLKTGVRFKINDNVFTILKRLPGLKIEAHDDSFDDIKIFTYDELLIHLSNGSLKFECKGKNTLADEKIRTSFSINNIENERHKDEAIFRYEVIKPILNIPYIYRSYEDIRKRVEEINSVNNDPKLINEKLNGCSFYKKVSYTSLYRWIRDFNESGCDFKSLLPSYYNCGGKDKPRIPLELYEMIQESINENYKNQQRITGEELRYIVLNKIAELNKFSIVKYKCPSRATFARILAKIPEYELVAKRIGKRSAYNQFNPIMEGVTATYPLERVEIDHTPIDVMIIDENGKCLGRPYLVMAIDKCTRMPLGFSIGVSNGVGWAEVMPCIKHIMTEKSYVNKIYPFIENKWTAFGIPKKIVVDNGLEFKNNAMKEAAYQLGFELQFCPPKVPQWKASIERFFGTTNSGLIHNMPGTTRSNYSKLGDNENPTKSAKLTFSIFLGIVYKWIVDVYSQSINSGINQKPAVQWENLIDEYPVSWPNDLTEAAVLLGKTCNRKITRRGIEMDSLRYNSIELNKLLMRFTTENNGFEQSFQIKYDPYDLGIIFVYDHLVSKSWIKVPCVDFDYSKNLTEWEHNEIKAHARVKYSQIEEESLAKAKADIRKMFETNSGYTPKQIARANKMNSETEIQRKLERNVKFENNIYGFNSAMQPLLSSESVSEIGSVFKTPGIVIPEAIIENNLTSSNVVNIQSSRDRKTKTMAKVKQNQTDTFVPNDLSGFGIISRSKEVIFDE